MVEYFSWRCARRSISFVVLLSALSGAPLVRSAFASAATLGVDTVSYFNSMRSEKDAIRSSLNARWQGTNSGPWFESSAKGQISLNLSRVSYDGIEFPEAYFGTSPRLSSGQLFIGRRLEQWNHLDERWKLGIIQPCFRYDVMAPDTVGLLGAFLVINRPEFQFVAFGTPIFIPERGAQLEFKDGVARSHSPWIPLPSNRTAVFGKDTPLQYELMMPPLGQLVAHPGTAVMTRVGSLDEGPWGSASYAYKPMNQVIMGFDPKFKINSSSVDVKLYPRVLYHHVGSLEAGFAGKIIGGWFSFLGEQPVRDQTPSSWTTQEVTPSMAVSSSVDISINGKGSSATKVDVSYLRQWGGNASDLGPYKSKGSAFDARYPYQDALSVGLKLPLYPVLGDWGRRFVASSRMLYDLKTEGSIVSAEFKYRHKDSWTLGFGADILTSGVDNPVDGAVDFITRFRANDRVHGGVTYAF